MIHDQVGIHGEEGGLISEEELAVETLKGRWIT